MLQSRARDYFATYFFKHPRNILKLQCFDASVFKTNTHFVILNNFLEHLKILLKCLEKVTINKLILRGRSQVMAYISRNWADITTVCSGYGRAALTTFRNSVTIYGTHGTTSCLVTTQSIFFSFLSQGRSLDTLRTSSLGLLGEHQVMVHTYDQHPNCHTASISHGSRVRVETTPVFPLQWPRTLSGILPSWLPPRRQHPTESFRSGQEGSSSTTGHQCDLLVALQFRDMDASRKDLSQVECYFPMAFLRLNPRKLPFDHWDQPSSSTNFTWHKVCIVPRILKQSTSSPIMMLAVVIPVMTQSLSCNTIQLLGALACTYFSAHTTVAVGT